MSGGGASPVPPPRPLRVGGATVIACEDAAGPFFRGRKEAFPDATADQWAGADKWDPQAVEAGRWVLRFRCYAIRLDDGRTIVVDAGVGPAGSPASAWAPGPGRLPEELDAAGVAPDDVTTVVLTHLHEDHTGWAVVEGRPFFRNARYVLQRAEYEAVTGRARRTVVEPLAASGQLSLVDGEERLARGVRVRHTPGHTPGHQSVLLEAGDDLLALTGDVLVHTVQLLHPEVGYAYEWDATVARATRESFLAEVAARGGVLATAHLTHPYLRLPLP